MGRDEAKALISKWRAKAELAKLFKPSDNPERAKAREKQIQAYEECADDLDKACRRLS